MMTAKNKTKAGVYMYWVHFVLEIVSRIALLFFTLLISAVVGTFVISLFLPNFSQTLTIVSIIVVCFVVFVAIYVLFMKLDEDEKLWDYVPNILKKSDK